MASNPASTFPIIPTRSWWALRRRFKQSLPATVTPQYLSTWLDMAADTARKNVLLGLKATGLVDEDGKVTDLGKRWRDDHEYPAVCQEIRTSVYPEDLVSAMPGPEVEREVLVRWFQTNASLGAGRAGAAAAFYELLANADPAKEDAAQARSAGAVHAHTQRSAKKTNNRVASRVADGGTQDGAPTKVSAGFTRSVHIDLHFHVSPDTTADQIDQIFESMARHLNLREDVNGQ